MIKNYEKKEPDFRNEKEFRNYFQYGAKLLEVFDELAKGKKIEFSHMFNTLEIEEKDRKIQLYPSGNFVINYKFYIDAEDRTIKICDDIKNLGKNEKEFEKFISDANKALEIYKKIFGGE